MTQHYYKYSFCVNMGLIQSDPVTLQPSSPVKAWALTQTKDVI